MDLKGGEIVSLIHYSGKYMLMGVVFHAFDDILEVIPLQWHSLFNFFEEDPIVVGFKTHNEVNLCECVIRNVDLAGHHLELKINDIKSNFDKRLFERFPVSTYADLHDEKGSGIAFVKNLSIGGAGIVTKQELNIGETVKIDLNIEQLIVPINAHVVWKVPNKAYFEYGLQFNYADEETKLIIMDYIATLKEEHERNLKRFKTAYKRLKTNMEAELH